MPKRHPHSKRAKARDAARARRASNADLREAAFEAMAAGWSHGQIADARKVNVLKVRREIDRALSERRLDAPDRYAHFQVARLTKALRLADAMIDRGDLKAVGPMVSLVAALDRYHGLADRSFPARRAPLAIAPMAQPTSLPEPAPPLALPRRLTKFRRKPSKYQILAPKALISFDRRQNCTFGSWPGQARP